MAIISLPKVGDIEDVFYNTEKSWRDQEGKVYEWEEVVRTTVFPKEIMKEHCRKGATRNKKVVWEIENIIYCQEFVYQNPPQHPAFRALADFKPEIQVKS